MGTAQAIEPSVIVNAASITQANKSISSDDNPRLVASSGEDERPKQQTTPSVQADDVILSTANKPATQAPPISESPPPTVVTTGHSRASRPKRPSLGFNGQGLRKQQAGQSRPNEQGSSSATSSSPANSINGIRRPSLSNASTTSTTTSAPANLAAGPGATAFQNRLTSASAKLRNKFRRPFNSTMNNFQQPSSLLTNFQPESSNLFDSSNNDLGGSQSQAIGSIQSLDGPNINGQPPFEARIGDIFANQNAAAGSTSPTVGSDEVLIAVSNSAPDNAEPASQTKPQSRSGEQAQPEKEPQLLSGGLVQSGSIESNIPLSLDGFFSDQPQDAPGGNTQPGEASEHHAKHHNPISHPHKKHNNDRLNGWLDQHNNKYIPRQANHHELQQHQGQLSQQLATNPNLLAPSFVANIQSGSSSPSVSQVKPTQSLSSVASSASAEVLKPAVGADDVNQPAAAEQNKSTNALDTEQVQLQTITKTYSTVMSTYKTRLVPLQVKSSTAIYTITENYIITKMLTSYQTMPVGEFILPESMSTRSPFEMFNEPSSIETKSDQPVNAPAQAAPGVNHIAPSEPQISQEQPISLDTSSQKTGNDWLHDFSNLNSNNQQQQQQTNNLAALLEQQAQENNGLFPPGLSLNGDALDGLASTLDPAALLADGAINIPDLNNPLVLAAAIQNPQLAAVILAAQQLQLKQRQNKLNGGQLNQQQLQPNQVQQLQPSYSTTFSTVIRPSIHTVRDTMYTTRLVSFKDGRTVRTRTVSEPGQVIEQVLTTMATEITPITITIKPTGVLSQTLATAAPGNGQNSAANHQTTINNALIATQLANLLARRQQQIVQPNNNFGSNSAQLAALQQILGQQQARNNQQQQLNNQVAKQFQPNFQQLLQTMQNQPQQQQQQQQQPSSSPSSLSPANIAPAQNGDIARANPSGSSAADKKESVSNQVQLAQASQPTPPLPLLAPITTTLTSLQVRTYTVHNAFKTIFRTITSTQLITSTLFPGGQQNTRLPSMG